MHFHYSEVNPGEPLFLVVTATPAVFKTLVAEQEYGSIWRYPYMIDNNRDNAFIIGGAAQVRITFYPLGFFERAQAASGSLNLYGNVEYRETGLNLGSGKRSGFVDATSDIGSATDMNTKARPVRRP